MVWWVIVVEMVVFAALFTTIIFTYYQEDRKYSPTSIHNYPPDIQDEYFKTHERIDVSYRSKSVLLTKSLGVVIFTAILLGCALIAGAKTFWQGFWLSFGLMVWIGIYDTCFLDWVLFANLPMFRLEGTEHMDAAYHQKWFHTKGMLFPGIIFALIPAALVGLMVMWIRFLLGNTAQFAKQEPNSLYSVKMPMMPPYFLCGGKPNQTARQGLSARIRFASANMMLNFVSCF